MHIKKLTTITVTAISTAMLLTACGGTSSDPQPASEINQDADSAATSDSGSVDADINLDALNESVKAIQDLNLTGDASTDSGKSTEDASAQSGSADTSEAAPDTTTDASETTEASDTSEPSDNSKPEGDLTQYSYTDVYRDGNGLTVIPNGQLNASTVLFNDKDLAGFLDYVDSTVLEEGRTINRELFYGLLSTMLIDKELSSAQPDSIEKYMMMALAIANNFHNLDVSVKDCRVNADNVADYNYTMKTSERDDIWIINYEKQTIYMNNGNTEYVSDMFKDEYLAVWLMAIEEYYGINP